MTTYPTTLLCAARDLLLGGRCAACERPGSVLCPGCRQQLREAAPLTRGPARPDPSPHGLGPVWACGRYDAALRSLLLSHKEHGQQALARPLGAVLAAAVDGLLTEQLQRPLTGPLVLVPVPSRPAAVRERGRDATLALVRAAALVLGGRSGSVAVAPLLSTRRGVLDQAGLDATRRADNLDRSMRVRSREVRRLARRTPRVGALVVCDDVITTGASLAEASRALRAVGLLPAGCATVGATPRNVKVS